MAPGILSEDVPIHGTPPSKNTYPAPLKPSGALDHFKSEETTPVIGREYFDVNIVDDLLNAENADDRLRDLAIASESRYESQLISTDIEQSLSEAWSSSASKIT